MTESPQSPRSKPFALRWLIPGVLVLGLLVDVASRFVPYDAVAFRAWEAMTSHAFVQRAWGALRGRPPATLGSFQPNRRYENDAAYGDLAARSNRPRMRQVHREIFTTDALGLRNPGPLDERRVAVVLGSSFTAGSTLSDDETLPAQLAPLLGGGVYNAGTALVGDDASLDGMLDRLNLAPDATLIFESLEKYDPPLLASPGGPAPVRALRRLLGERRYIGVRLAYADMLGWLSASPFRIVLQHLRTRLENGTLLPNSELAGAELGQFPQGDSILFLPEDKAIAENPDRPAGAGIPYWRHLKEHLARHGLRLLVLLVPMQYTIYAPLTLDSPAALPGPSYLARTADALRDADIPFVNVTEEMQAAARAGLPRRHYYYWRDDTHWNPDGVALVARAVAARLAQPR